MSRSEYSDACEGWALIRWRGAVKAAMRGNRGIAFLREALAALDAMPTKRLISDHLHAKGEVCLIGAVGVARGVSMERIDPEDADCVSTAFGIAPAMAREIVFMNDEAGSWRETPEQRFCRMREWLVREIAAAEKARGQA
ncbi:hypothetical protein EOD42_16655 [Rhodovarius crocodyli]|uniref:Uncharacterized protein n=1 Tax=Rhodovarius crocodyli TaxID=1979269 RepID=A0A437MC65_9PROT|nr:hypothetical protein [Rhodovarius crocodyli]RVT95215.1 hypothetical protein EOD42_16655 [Rhodovarius crocodyli]